MIGLYWVCKKKEKSFFPCLFARYVFALFRIFKWRICVLLGCCIGFEGKQYADEMVVSSVEVPGVLFFFFFLIYLALFIF